MFINIVSLTIPNEMDGEIDDEDVDDGDDDENRRRSLQDHNYGGDDISSPDSPSGG